MVKAMNVCAGTGKKGGTYLYLEIDFGYRQEKVFDFNQLLFPELCGVNPDKLYALKDGEKLPVVMATNK